MSDYHVQPASVGLLGVIVMVFAGSLPAWAQTGAAVEVGTFSRATVGQSVPDGWKPLTFKKIPKQTTYEVVQDGDRPVVKASSDASASGLIKEVKIDPRQYPIVRWRWKVENLLKTSDAVVEKGKAMAAEMLETWMQEHKHAQH